jgi:predicted porin
MQYKRLAAAAMFTCLPLAAVAQTTNVQLYGVIDAGVAVQDTGNPGEGRTTQVGSGNQSTSRFGFKGTEDLGNGLKAIFNLEAGFNADDGKSDADTGKGLFQRRAVVGLEGSFGQLTIGREYSPIAAVAGSSDIFGQGFYGTNLSAFGSSPDRLTRRLANSVNYKSASYNGLKFLAAYSAGEKATGPSNDLKGVGLEYANGPLYLGAAYHTIKRLDSNDDKQYAVGAGYNFGSFEVKGNWMVADGEGVATGKYTQYNLGAAVPVGEGKFYVNLQQNKNDANDAKGNAWAVAYSYTLSKRTNLYASYASLNNNSLATFGLSSSSNNLVPAATAKGADPDVFAVGIRHTF